MSSLPITDTTSIPSRRAEHITPCRHRMGATSMPQPTCRERLDFTHSGSGHRHRRKRSCQPFMPANFTANKISAHHCCLNDGTGHFTISSGRLPPAQTNLNQNVYSSSQFVDVDGDRCSDLVLGGDFNTQSVVLINDCHGTLLGLAECFAAKAFRRWQHDRHQGNEARLNRQARSATRCRLTRAPVLCRTGGPGAYQQRRWNVSRRERTASRIARRHR